MTCIHELKYMHANVFATIPIPLFVGSLSSFMDRRYTSIPATPEERRLVKHLHLYGVCDVPPEVLECPNLTHLNMICCRLERLPGWFHRLTQLEELNLAYNRLRLLPSEIGELQALTHLNVANNLLTSLPLEIGQLKALTEINLAGNPLRVVPLPLGRMPSLTKVCMDQRFADGTPVTMESLRARCL